ncbi:DUF1634 domain-containing protein [Chryseobacterium sp. G0162]|uniref:DUF1634 domain-containing protein n=1 Tax=Chryseobacterium sp. G0162 TaxID=2487063 RepID=UPI000F501C56|nr:DUF1634 domain-containing protein [Chryseobacterium sp. G0162]AZB11863.1 DUF1634 domain-containing protein [Chryseobacterium sp. G0162]
MEVTDKTIRNLVGNVLKYGVRSVLCIGIIGGGIFLSNHETEKVDYSHFTEKEENIFKVIGDIFSGAVNLDGSSIIYIGILVLFCTPFLRVILSLISFALEKDKLYVGITTVVILIICLSVYFGFGH